MSSDPTTDSPGNPAPKFGDDGEWFYISDLKVSNNRMQIRVPACNRRGIVEECILDVIIKTPGDSPDINIGQTAVKSQRRIQVDQDLVKAHGLEGEVVDIMARHTGEQVDE